jgi:hypothetical protein
MNQLIRDQLGYDGHHLFTEQEIDVEGMSRVHGFKNQVEIEVELQKRREAVNEKKKFIEF